MRFHGSSQAFQVLQPLLVWSQQVQQGACWLGAGLTPAPALSASAVMQQGADCDVIGSRNSCTRLQQHMSVRPTTGDWRQLSPPAAWQSP